MPISYLEPTQQAGAALFSCQFQGEVVMLNLLRFKAVAGYSQYPQLAPADSISGSEAYQRYIEHTLPFLRQSGGDILYMGPSQRGVGRFTATASGYRPTLD